LKTGSTIGVFPNLMGTVTLRSSLKSSEFRAILWLLLRGRDNELTANLAVKLPMSARSPLISRQPVCGQLLGLSRHEIPKQLHGIGAQGAGNRNKFHDIYTAFTTLIFGNKRLRPAKFFGKGLLTNARSMSHCDKSGNKPGIFRRFKGLLHAPPSLRIGGRKFDPENGLSQNWIISTIRAIAWQFTPGRGRHGLE
jgi:hypothetical protein